jgi:acyl dehydratase
MSTDEWQKLLGQPLGTSDWQHIDQQKINEFASVTGDHQAIHVDTEFAKSGPFGTTVAHGFLLVSIVPELIYPILKEQAADKVWLNYGSNKLRFVNPVKVDSDVRIHVVLAKVEEKGPGAHLLQCDINMEIKGQDKPAFISESLFMLLDKS